MNACAITICTIHVVQIFCLLFKRIHFCFVPIDTFTFSLCTDFSKTHEIMSTAEMFPIQEKSSKNSHLFYKTLGKKKSNVFICFNFV